MGVFKIFAEPVFWIIMGLLYALIGYSATLWAKDLGLKMNGWKWILSWIWYLLVSISVAGGFTLMGENEVKAGFYFLGVSLFICIVLGVILWRILSIGRKIKKKTFD